MASNDRTGMHNIDSADRAHTHQNGGRIASAESRHDERDQPYQPRNDPRTHVQQPRNDNPSNSTIKNRRDHEVPWYFPSLLSRASEYMDSPTPSERVDSQRERDDDCDRGRVSESEREEEEEPWNDNGEKREREEGRDDGDGDDSHSNSHRHKRRRRVEESSLAFYDTIHASSEVQRIIFENTAGTYFLLFKLCPWLGFNGFFASWSIILVVGHTLQAALTNFEHHSGYFRLMPLIPPDIHVWMDNYIWNQPIVTFMLLYPHWFADGPAPIWLGCTQILGMMADNLVSLKDDYECYKPRITIPVYRRKMEAGFFDIALSMTMSFVLIVSSQFWSIRWLLWVGLAFLNIPPAYFLWAHRQRIQYGIRMSNDKSFAYNGKSIISENCNDKKVV